MSASITSGTYPRAAQPASGGLSTLATRLWTALTRLGAHRAHPELMRLAQSHARTNPALAQQLRDAARDLMKA